MEPAELLAGVGGYSPEPTSVLRLKTVGGTGDYCKGTGETAPKDGNCLRGESTGVGGKGSPGILKGEAIHHEYLRVL